MVLNKVADDDLQEKVEEGGGAMGSSEGREFQTEQHSVKGSCCGCWPVEESNNGQEIGVFQQGDSSGNKSQC